MLVDVCMWAKNGERFLPIVLKRIDDVIGRDINQKIFVDDSSTDRSVEIAKSFGWKVYPNIKGYINGGTNEALKHVTTDFFVSFEQDVLLNRNWWNIIQKYMKQKDVAVAQGIRISTNPIYGTTEKYTIAHTKPRYHTIDNNLYRTEVIKKLGFTEEPWSMASFYDKIINNGHKWIVDKNLISIHLRKSLLQDLKHRSTIYIKMRRHNEIDNYSLAQLLFSLLLSAKFIKSRNPYVLLTYTLVRLSNIFIKIKRGNRKQAWRRQAR